MAQTADQLLREMAQPDLPITAEKNLLSWRSPRNIDQVIYCTRDGKQIKFIDKNHGGDHWMPHVSQIGEPVYTARHNNCFVAVTMDEIEPYVISCYMCRLDNPVVHCNDTHRLQYSASAEIADILLDDTQLIITFRNGRVRKISLSAWNRTRSNSL